MQRPERQAILLFGPTAAGKTSSALALAKHFNGEVINTDSRQIYQNMPIITAMPSKEEFATVPHHLYSFLSPKKPFSVKEWLTHATQKAEDLFAVGKTPIFVGGTGLYFKALMEGLSEIPPVEQELLNALEARFYKEGAQTLYKELLLVDGDWAAKIEQTDKQRILRGLSVYQETGKPLTFWQSKKRVGALNATFKKIALSPEPNILRERIYLRYQIMVKDGVVAEAKQLYDQFLKNLTNDTVVPPAFKSIGLMDYQAFFEKKCTEEEAHKTVQTRMCRYAKRQRTWLRNSFGEANVFTHADALVKAVSLQKEHGSVL